MRVVVAWCLEAKIVQVILQLSGEERNGYFCGYHVDGRNSDRRLDKLFQVAHFSGASGSRSITYLPRATLMMGAPGILLLWLLEFGWYSENEIDV